MKNWRNKTKQEKGPCREGKERFVLNPRSYRVGPGLATRRGAAKRSKSSDSPVLFVKIHQAEMLAVGRSLAVTAPFLGESIPLLDSLGEDFFGRKVFVKC